MVASFRIIFKIGLQKIGEKEYFQDYEKHKEFDQNNQPNLLSPSGKIGKSFTVKLINLFKCLHFVSVQQFKN